MRTRVGSLCLLVLVLELVPSLAVGLSDPGGLAAVKEVVGVPALVERLGSRAAAEPSEPLRPPRVIPRAAWGADETIRLRARRGRPRFSPVRKLIVHHTVTRRWEPPRRAVRRIYRWHTLTRGFADIAYHYLIAPDGRIFKGRYAGPPGTRRRDRPWADKRGRLAVRGAHTMAANEGTVGVALLGTYEKRPLPGRARASLVRLLAWLSDRYGIDPRGVSRYPLPGGRLVETPNIAGHRAYGRTACPGERVRRELPSIRREVAQILRASSRVRSRGPLITEVRIPRVWRRGAIVRWRTDEPARALVSVRPRGGGAMRRTRPGLTTRHEMRLSPLRRGADYVVRVGGRDEDGNVSWTAPHALRTKS